MEIKVLTNIMDANDRVAQENRKYFRDNNIRVVNIMSSPGSGKTSLILKLAELLKKDTQLAVIEGDIASSIDAEKIIKQGVPALQINTGGACHLDSSMISDAAKNMDLAPNTLLFIENVGNLVCPASFDLGEDLTMVIASVSEGDDKPYKYPKMFEKADIIVLNKVDLLVNATFDREFFIKGVRALNSKAPIVGVSCRTGQNIKELAKLIL